MRHSGQPFGNFPGGGDGREAESLFCVPGNAGELPLPDSNQYRILVPAAADGYAASHCRHVHGGAAAAEYVFGVRGCLYSETDAAAKHGKGYVHGGYDLYLHGANRAGDIWGGHRLHFCGSIGCGYRIGGSGRGCIFLEENRGFRGIDP